MDFSAEPFIQKALKDKSFTVGNDIVFLPDFKHTWNELFKNKAYTNREISYCEQFDDPLLRYASTWAAKEAVYKAIKQLDRTSTGFKTIEIIREKPAGQPQVHISNREQKFQLSLSITHDGEYVWAVAIANLNEGLSQNK